MNKYELSQALKGLILLQNVMTADIDAYLDLIFKHCSWIDAEKFILVCAEWEKIKRPREKLGGDHFIAKYYELADRHGWQKREGTGCKSCGGRGLGYVWVRDEQDREYKAMKGCNICRPEMSNLKIGLTEIPEPVGAVTKVEDLKLQPSHAKILFRIAETAGFKLTEAMWERLTFFASQEDRCLEVLEREAMSTPPPYPDDARKAEKVLSDAALEAHYANLPTPGAPRPRPAPAQKVPEAVPSQAAPSETAAPEQPAVDMPFSGPDEQGRRLGPVVRGACPNSQFPD